MQSGVAAQGIPVLPTTLRVEHLEHSGFVPYINQLLPVYMRVFEIGVDRLPSTKARLHAHSGRKDFQSIIVFDGTAQIAAFSYGYVGRKGEYFNDFVRTQMLAVHGKELTNFWLDDVFEVVEVAVDAPFRGKGFGDLVLRELLSKVNARTALLAVRADNEAAINLYAKHGWENLLPSVRFPNELTPYMVMGLRMSHR